MSELRNKMKMYMELKGYSSITTKYYLTHISNFAKFYNKSPHLLGEKEICGYLHYCITEKHLTEGSVGAIYNALKILYTKVLMQTWDVNKIPRIKERRRLPIALSPEEIKAIFDVVENIKHKAILMTIYSGGLRVSEVCNLKVTDMQAALGLSQLEKLPSFIEKRKENYSKLYKGLKQFEEYLILPEPTYNSEPSWFGFPITIKESAEFSRNDITRFLENNKIGTRLLFAGNILKQPLFTESKLQYMVVSELTNTDLIMSNTFWIGVWPGINDEQINYIVEVFKQFLFKIQK